MIKVVDYLSSWQASVYLSTHDETQRAYVTAVDLSSIGYRRDSKTDVVVSINTQTVGYTLITSASIMCKFVTEIYKTVFGIQCFSLMTKSFY